MLEDSRVLKKVSSVFQEKFINSFKDVSRILQFCCMNIIAATRAEGGLVFYSSGYSMRNNPNTVARGGVHTNIFSGHG